MNFKNLFYLIFYPLCILACNEKKYSIPILSNKFIKEKNFSIAQLKNLPNRDRYKITQNFVIEGYISANDIGGNFYKEIFIQDDSGGISIQIVVNPTEFNHDKYPLGKKLRILTRGLFLEKKNDNSQLGSTYPSNQFSGILHPGKHIFLEESKKVSIKAKELKIEELKDKFLGTLIKIKNLTFDVSAKEETFFPKDAKGYYGTHILKNCQGKEIHFMVNKNAQFANKKTPKSLVNLRGILTKYGDKYQLKIRSLEDIEKSKEPCSSIYENYLKEFSSEGIEIENENTTQSIRSTKTATQELSSLEREELGIVDKFLEEASTNVNNYESKINQIQEEEKKNPEIRKEFSTDKLEDLIFSQYIRLKGKEKYLSIYNGTGREVNLSKYEVERVDKKQKSYSQNLSGNLADGQTLVLKHPSAIIYGKNIQKFDEKVMDFGIRDQILLKKERDIIDKIGDTNWSPTRGNKKLKRKKTKGPNPNYESDEWDEIEEASINNPATFYDLGKAP